MTRVTGLVVGSLAFFTLLGGCESEFVVGKLDDPAGAKKDSGQTGGGELGGALTDAQSGACGTLEEAACLLRDDCHALFDASATFGRCADGTATCAGRQVCAVPEPDCNGPHDNLPFVVSYGSGGGCAEGCVRAEQCNGCDPSKFQFTQANGCLGDGALEFCLQPDLRPAVQAIAPEVVFGSGFSSGRAGCNESRPLTFFPATVENGACLAEFGALTDEAYAKLCKLSMLPQVQKIVFTFFE